MFCEPYQPEMNYFDNTIATIEAESFDAFFKEKYERDEKMYALITLCIYPLFYFLDYFVVSPELSPIFLQIRLWGAFVIAIALILCIKRKLNYTGLMYMMKITIIVGVNMMFLLVEQKDMLTYNINYCSLYLAATFIAPWRHTHSFIIVTIDLICYLFVCINREISLSEQVATGRLVVMTCWAFYIFQMYIRFRNLRQDYEKQLMLVRAYKSLTDKSNWINNQYHQLVIYKESLDATSDGILILVLNTNLSIKKVHYVNKNFVRFTGFDGKNMELIKPLFLKKANLDFESNLRDLIELPQNRTRIYEIEYMHKNGNRMHGDISVSVLNRDQNQIHLIVIIRDVTIKKLIQQKVVNQKFRDHIANMAILTDTLEKERSRFSEDLHEGIGQVLVAGKANLNCYLNSRNKEKNEVLVQTTIDLLTTAINEMKLIVFHLVPPSLKEFGLATALDELCKREPETGNYFIDFKTNLWNKRLSKNIEIHVWRLIQEAVATLLDGSEASEVTILLCKINRYVIIQIKNNGNGMSLTEAKHKLKNIRIRAEMLNARLFVSTRPQVNGTHVEVLFNQDRYPGSLIYELKEQH